MLPAEEVVRQINVEVESLKEIAATMRADLENGYRTQVPEVHDAMRPGASIGAGIAGSEWVGLQDLYHRCIDGTLNAIYNIDKGTDAMAQAADLIAKRYGSADALAHASAEAVDQTLTGDSVAPAAPSGEQL
jgi:hypothetical protein